MGVLQELRARREQLQERDPYFDYEVPGYEPEAGQASDLVIRFEPMPYGSIVRYQAAAAAIGLGAIDDEDVEEMARLDADSLVKSCREFLVREDEALKPIVEGETTTFSTVDDALGFKADTAIEAVLGVFAGNEREIGRCAAALRIWTERTDRRAAEDLAGKSNGGRSSSGPPADSTSD